MYQKSAGGCFLVSQCRQRMTSDITNIQTLHDFADCQYNSYTHSITGTSSIVLKKNVDVLHTCL